MSPYRLCLVQRGGVIPRGDLLCLLVLGDLAAKGFKAEVALTGPAGGRSLAAAGTERTLAAQVVGVAGIGADLLEQVAIAVAIGSAAEAVPVESTDFFLDTSAVAAAVSSCL
jgi:hypothetical protein